MVCYMYVMYTFFNGFRLTIELFYAELNYTNWQNYKQFHMILLTENYVSLVSTPQNTAAAY